MKALFGVIRTEIGIKVKATKDTHGVGSDQGGGNKAGKKESGAGGKGAAAKKSGSVGQSRPRAGSGK